MTLPLLMLVLAAAPCTTDPVPPEPAFAALSQAPDSLRRAFERGQTWNAFYDAADSRRETWERNWIGSRVSDDLVARARTAGAGLRILAIADARCSDSASSLPYVARLVEAVPSLELRVIGSRTGRPWMEAHRTPDGRAATPTLLILNDRYEIVGCWVEQPRKLQEWWLDVVARGTQAAHFDRKMKWYAEDAGRETLREIVEILEAAQAGRRICPGAG